MTGTWFVDTNALVYDLDRRDPDKQQRASEWIASIWDRRRLRTSIQVLSEFYNTITRKLDPGYPAAAARELVTAYLAWHPVPVDEHLIQHALELDERLSLSWWDSLIAAAQLQACDYLLTEDLQDGQDLAGVSVVDPFAHAPKDYA